jgi:O-antigen ligase
MTQLDSSAKAISRLMGGLLILTTIAVTPWMTIDPINLIKLVTLSTVACGIGAVLALNFRKHLFLYAREATVLSLLFVSQLVLVFATSSSDKALQFFGTMGRNTGLLFYLALILVLLGAVVISATAVFQKSIYLLTGVGLLSAVYGLIQYLGLDPINWANKYSPIIGFLGNPNFQSSLLGLSTIGGLVILFDRSQNNPKRILALFFIFAALFIVVKSNSQQGLLVFALGLACMGFFKVISLEKPIYTYLYVAGSVFISIISVFGFLNKGPLSNFLYQASVTYRGDYWRAGWNMALDNPLFGVGLDAYGDNYRSYRTLEATLRRGPDVVTNAAHNVFIDLAANGGFILFAIYCCFILLALKKVVDYTRSSVRDVYFEGVIAVWVAFLAQSVISINQIGLAVWGWVLTGLIIGWHKNLSDQEKSISRKGSSKPISTNSLDPKTLLTLLAGLTLGLFLSLPPLISSANEKSAMATTQLEKILSAERKWPRDPARSNQIVRILVSNSLNEDALRIAKLSTIQFPDNFESWKVLSQIPNLSDQDRNEALKRMRELDPLNQDLA